MHPIAKELQQALESGRRHIGQLVMLQNLDGHAYAICHLDDLARVEKGELDHLERLSEAREAREWGLYSEEGEYRFTKGQANLKPGFLFLLDDVESLYLTVEYFYPAQLALWLAEREGQLKVQNLYDKLGRQTGMYKFAKNISAEGAQQLVKKICGPGNQCLKKIHWQLDENSPLEDSEASRFDGILEGVPRSQAIPMQCQEACNFFVAECRKVSRKEFAAKQEEG